jgi:hypothetical protein
MRSINSLNRNFGIQSAQLSARSIVRNGFDRDIPRATGAHLGYPSRSWSAMRDMLRRLMATATRVTKRRVTGGACGVVALQSSGRHAAWCRPAAC